MDQREQEPLPTVVQRNPSLASKPRPTPRLLKLRLSAVTTHQTIVMMLSPLLRLLRRLSPLLPRNPRRNLPATVTAVRKTLR